MILKSFLTSTRSRAAALLAGFMFLGLTAACGASSSASSIIRDVSLATAKSIASEVIVQAAKGDTKARKIAITALDEYCKWISDRTRTGLRQGFSVNGKAALTVDCSVVQQLTSALGDTSKTITEPPSNRRALVLLRDAGAKRTDQG